MFSHGRGGVCGYEACPFMKMGEGYKHQAYLISSSVHIQFSRTASCDPEVDAKFMLGQTQTKPQGQIASATRPQTLQST